MAKPWLVARRTYLDAVRKRSFVLATLAIPAAFAVLIGISILVVSGGEDSRPLGYVDLAGLLEAGQPGDAELLRPFADEAGARAALNAGELQGYVVLPAGYRTGQPPRLVYLTEAPSGDALRAFDQQVRSALAAGLAPDVRDRLLNGISVTLQSAGGGRSLASDDFLSFLIPLFAGLFYMFAVLSASGYLLQAMTTEKENRTVEIMATSLSPMQLIAGKTVGLFAVAMTQLALWAATAVAALLVLAAATDFLRGVHIPWPLLGIVVLYFVPSFALVAGIMIALGGIVADLQQGQQIAGIVNLLFVAPFFVFVVILARPDGPLAVAMTLFPTTAFLTVAMRWGVTTVPAWQIAAGLLGLLICAAAAIWVAGRIFRLGMLRYGQRLDWPSIRAALRSRDAARDLAGQ